MPAFEVLMNMMHTSHLLTSDDHMLIAGEADSDAASEGYGDGGCEHGVVASAANLAEDEDSPQRA